MILVDTNVLLDLVTDDPAGWSQQQLDIAAAHDQLAINDIVHAELSIGCERMKDLDGMIHSAGLVNALTPRPALFLAGAGGRKTGALPDFIIALTPRSPALRRSPAMHLAIAATFRG